MSERRILVSGGSRGLGLAYCTHYLEQGHSVFTFSRKAPDSWAALGSRFGQRFSSIELDLGAHGGATTARDAAVEAMGGIDVLVNNAAIGQDSLLSHMPEGEISRLVHVNLTATILLTRGVVKQMIQQGEGVVLNVTSISASRGFPGLAVYAATKGALEAFTRCLAAELGPLNVRVNAIAPGLFGSDMSSVLGSAQIDVITRRTPTGRLSEIDEIVKASDVLIQEGQNITGQVLGVDGGASVA